MKQPTIVRTVVNLTLRVNTPNNVPRETCDKQPGASSNNSTDNTMQRSQTPRQEQRDMRHMDCA